MRGTRLLGALTCIAAIAATGTASAATTELVTENDVARQAEGTTPTKSWVIYTRNGGLASFEFGPASPPLGVGSLELTTTTGSDKVYAFNYDHVGTDLDDVDAIAYSTYRTSGNLQQVNALNLEIDFNGPAVSGGYAVLVFEPVYNITQGPVVSGQWQDWDAINAGTGVWWSSRPINNQCSFSCYRTWDQIRADNPDAVILGGVGVNQGTGNPGLTSAADAFTFDETTYDFEPTPASKEDCKKGGWADYGDRFPNQGQCVASFAPGRNR